MKRKKFNKRLALNKSTIANLGDEALKNAKGGYSDGAGGCFTEGPGPLCKPTAKCPPDTSDTKWTGAGENCSVLATCYHLGCE